MRIYTSQPIALNAAIEISDPQFNHIIRVMRKKEGDELTLFNGQGGEYKANIMQVNKRSLIAETFDFVNDNRSSKLNIHLIQSFAKFDKMDFVFQKATELGIATLTPFTSEHSSFKLSANDKQDKKLSHWQSIIESACEQCGCNIIPKLTDFASLKTIHEFLDERPYLILSPTAQQSLGQWIDQQPMDQTKFGIIIGPEGGFSNAEMKFFSTHPQCHSVSLGNRILRTETVALSVLSSLHSRLGDWA